jgi:hypothetical protein
VADERVTLRQAAARLGVSESAIRKRVERGTLRSDKGADGRRYVYLDTRADTVADEVADVSASHERDELISELRAHNETLRDQLEVERQAHAEARRLLFAALERIPPAIEPPRSEAPSAQAEDAPESPVSPGPTPTPAPTGVEREMVTEMPMGPTPSESSEAAQEGSEHRSWWQRWFGVGG